MYVRDVFGGGVFFFLRISFVVDWRFQRWERYLVASINHRNINIGLGVVRINQWDVVR